MFERIINFINRTVISPLKSLFRLNGVTTVATVGASTVILSSLGLEPHIAAVGGCCTIAIAFLVDSLTMGSKAHTLNTAIKALPALTMITVITSMHFLPVTIQLVPVLATASLITLAVGMAADYVWFVDEPDSPQLA